jgi:hypothetical protein
MAIFDKLMPIFALEEIHNVTETQDKAKFTPPLKTSPEGYSTLQVRL